MSLKDVREKKEQEKSDRMKKLSETIKHNRIDYIVSVILKEVRKEDRLVKQILYAIFSTYTPDPINVAINSPSGEGKTYTLHGVVKYFPRTDVQILSGMSEKSIFHMEGDVVVMESEDEYVPISKYLDVIELQMASLKDDLKKLKDTEGEEKNRLRSQIRKLENEHSEVVKQGIKRIRLNNKVLIFQDTPKPELLEAMMPLLSHDEYRVHYKYVSKNNNNLTTTSNMLEGFPCVIYCQAIDTSNRERAAELQRRFVTYNPEMTEEKYKEAIDHIFNSTLPDSMYESEVVKKHEKDMVEALVYDMIKRIKLHSLNETRNIVLIPFWKSLAAGFNGSSSFDMNISDKIKKYLTLLPIINMDDRPCLKIEDKLIPFCTFKDLADTLYLNEFMYGGIKQYILEWYIKVFCAVWMRNKKTGVQSATTRNGNTATEDKVVVHMEELLSMTQDVYKENHTHSTLRNKYLNTLIYTGYVDEFPSNIKTSEKVFYPTAQEILKRYDTDKDGKVKLISKIIITYANEGVYPDNRYLYTMIQYILTCYPDSKIIDCDQQTELSIDELIKKYYSDPEIYFKTDDKVDEKELDKIISRSSDLPISTILDDYRAAENEIVICGDCHENVSVKDMEDHKAYYCRKRTM